MWRCMRQVDVFQSQGLGSCNNQRVSAYFLQPDPYNIWNEINFVGGEISLTYAELNES
jgi:hypothetical protein